MNFSTHNDCHIEARWSGVIGSLMDTSYHNLVRIFGPHEECPLDGNIQAQWTVKFRDGITLSIIDWKEDAPLDEITDWNIRGPRQHKEKILKRLQRIFKQHGINYPVVQELLF